MKKENKDSEPAKVLKISINGPVHQHHVKIVDTDQKSNGPTEFGAGLQ